MRGRFDIGLGLALVGALAVLAGCGGAPMQPPQVGTLTVSLTPTVPASGDLVVQGGQLELEGLSVFGDVAPDPRTMLPQVHLDLPGMGKSFTFDNAPQGIYSRVRLDVDNAEVEGTWRGTPLHASIEPPDQSQAVDLRAAGQEVGPGMSADFPIVFDVGSWFAGNLLDSAQVVSGEIVIDETHNTALGTQIASNMVASFGFSTSSASTAAAPPQ